MTETSIVISTAGTSGDAVPFIAIAKELQLRGHDVTLMTSSDHQALSLKEGIDFVPIGEPDWPQIRRDERAFFRHQLLPGYKRVEQHYSELISQGKRIFGIVRVGNWGGLFACERHGVPFVIVVPQPASIWDNGQPICDLDRLLVNRWRAEIGLPIKSGYTIPEPSESTIGLFPEWFGWPDTERMPRGMCAGFPFFDRSDAELPADIQQLIETKEGLVVFSAGTGVQDIDKFAFAAREFQAMSGRPVLLLSHYHHECRYPETRMFRVLPFLDHALLFPLAAVVIHNGGIGTVAQAIRAGVPQIVVPRVWDQPDNAQRLEALGLGGWIPNENVSADTVAEKVEQVERLDRKPLLLAQSVVQSQNATLNSVDEIERVMKASGYG